MSPSGFVQDSLRKYYSIATRIPPSPSWRTGGLQAWRTGAKGSLGWKMGASGLENWPLGVQNDARDLQIGAKNGPGRPKSRLGGSRDLQNWILDGLEGGLEASGLVWTAILGVQGAVWTPSWGHLGAPGGVSGTILDGFWGSQTGPERRFFGSEVEKCKLAKSSVFPCVFDDCGGSGALEIDQNGVKWLSKSVRDGWWTQNMHLGG